MNDEKLVAKIITGKIMLWLCMTTLIIAGMLLNWPGIVLIGTILLMLSFLM